HKRDEVFTFLRHPQQHRDRLHEAWPALGARTLQIQARRLGQREITLVLPEQGEEPGDGCFALIGRCPRHVSIVGPLASMSIAAVMRWKPAADLHKKSGALA